MSDFGKSNIVPAPLNWQNIEAFKELGHFVKKTAQELGIDIVWGGDWKSFRDYSHYEMRR